MGQPRKKLKRYGKPQCRICQRRGLKLRGCVCYKCRAVKAKVGDQKLAKRVKEQPAVVLAEREARCEDHARRIREELYRLGDRCNLAPLAGPDLANDLQGHKKGA